MNKRTSAAVLALSAVAGFVPVLAARPAVAANCLGTPTLTEDTTTHVVTGKVTNLCNTAQTVKVTVQFIANQGSTCPTFTKSGQVRIGPRASVSQRVTVPSGCTGTATLTALDGTQQVSTQPLTVT